MIYRHILRHPPLLHRLIPLLPIHAPEKPEAARFVDGCGEVGDVFGGRAGRWCWVEVFVEGGGEGGGELLGVGGRVDG